MDARTEQLVITIAAPVKRPSGLIGVIATDLFIDVLLQRVTSLRISEKSTAYLVDRTGLYIAHPYQNLVLTENINQSEDAEMFRNFVATERGSAIYGAEHHYTIMSRIPRAEWFLVLHLPYEDVQQPLQTLTLIFLAGLVATLIVLSVVIVMISHIIARPILRLANGASAMVEGNYDYRLPIPSSDELGFVTDSFNQMAAGLRRCVCMIHSGGERA